MTVTINGTTGVAGVDGTAATPAIQGNDTNTGIFFPAADTIAFAEGGVEVMRIDSAGRLITPYQPSSRYSRSGNVTYTSAAELLYNSNRLDIGNCYNTSTGRFTAPVRGAYIALANAYAVSGSGLAGISLRQNGVGGNNPLIQLTRNGSDYQTLNATGIFYMEAGDYLSVHWDAGSIYIDSNTSFSVALLG